MTIQNNILVLYFVLCSCVLSDNACILFIQNGEQYAECSKRHLKEIPTDLPHNVTSINLAWNDISRIAPGALEQYPNLTQLILTGNEVLGLRNISQQLYNINNVTPRRISLDHVSIEEPTTLYETIFCIDFYNKVTHLTLRSNKITSITLSCFHCVQNIQFLALGYNHVITLDIGTPEIPINIQYLYLFEKLPLPYRIFSRLRVLDISDIVSLHQVYVEKWKNATPQELFLHDTEQLYHEDLSIPARKNATFYNQIRLEKLYLQRFIYLSMLVSGGISPIVIESLKFVDASDNSGRKSVVAVSNAAPNLETLRCRSCSIYEVNDDVFKYMVHLVEVDASQNYLGVPTSDFTRMFKPLQKLEYLYLANNEIKQLPRHSFNNLTSLKHLDLSGNLLTYIESIMHSITLKNLLLNDNNLREDFISKELRDNLTTISIKSQTPVTIVIGPDLICSCKTLDFFDWSSQDNSNDIVVKNGSYCKFNEKILLLEEAQTTLGNANTCTGILIPILIIVFVIGAIFLGITIILFKYRIYIRWVLYKLKHIRTQRKHKKDTPTFDVYVSVANEDLAWTKEVILNYFEELNGMTVYLYERDSIGGECVYDNICYGISNSASVIVILSPHFIQDELKDWELSMAIASGKSRIAIVKIKDVTAQDIKHSGVLRYLILPAPKVPFHEMDASICGNTLLLDALKQHVLQKRTRTCNKYVNNDLPFHDPN